MSVRVSKAGGFFVVRSDGVQHLGDSWPECAIYSAAKRRAVSVMSRDRVMLRDGHGVDDELELARAEIEVGKAKSVAVGRHVGSFGRMNLYERVFDVTAEDGKAAPIEFCTTQACKDEREKKTVHFKIVKGAKARRIEGYASTPTVDRSQDVVDPTAFAESMPSFMTNPVMLFNHDMSRPVGKVVDFEVRSQGLWIVGEITDNQVWDWIDTDTVRALSASFIIQDRKIEMVGEGPDAQMFRRITKAELLEVSVVTIPDNRTTLFSVAKALADGTDVKCGGCASAERQCTCAETKAVVEHRRFLPAKKGAVDFSREAIVELGGVGLERLCCLVEKDGAPPLRHHGVQAGDVVTSPEAVRAALAALVAYSPLGAELSEPERAAAAKHLLLHLAEFGDQVEVDFTKGPQPELVAKLLGDSERGGWSVCFSTSTFKDPAKQREWLAAHGFADLQDRGEDAAWKRYGAGGDALLERHWLDNGVCAALYLVAPRGDSVHVTKNVPGEATPPAPAAAAAPPAPAAPQPAATTAASKASEPPAASEDLVEVESADLAALERAYDAAKDERPVDPDDVKRGLGMFESDE